MFTMMRAETTAGMVVVVTRRLRAGRAITRHTTVCQRCYPGFIAVARGQIMRQYAAGRAARCALCGSESEAGDA